jgi:hypothetical protein
MRANNCQYFIILKKQTIVDKVSFNPGFKKTFILFILIKNKAKQQNYQNNKTKI